MDHNFDVFHVKRVDGKPLIVKTPISPDLKIRAIKVSENKQKKYYGMALSGDGRIYLLAHLFEKIVKPSISP